MNILELTNEMLELSELNNLDIEILKSARENDVLDLEFKQEYIRMLSPEGLNYVFTRLREQTWAKAYKVGLGNCLSILNLKGYFVSKQVENLYEGHLIAKKEIEKLLIKEANTN